MIQVPPFSLNGHEFDPDFAVNSLSAYRDANMELLELRSRGLQSRMPHKVAMGTRCAKQVTPSLNERRLAGQDQIMLRLSRQGIYFIVSPAVF